MIRGPLDNSVAGSHYVDANVSRVMLRNKEALGDGERAHRATLFFSWNVLVALMNGFCGAGCAARSHSAQHMA